MAISTQRSLAELQKECAELGLNVVNPGKRPGKTEYVMALREFYFKRDFPNGIPREYTLLEELIPHGPSLCARLANEPKELQDPKNPQSPWNLSSWVAQEKMDGCRAVLPFISSKLHMFSRNVSVKTFREVDYSENLWLDYCQDGLNKIKDEFVLDAECVSARKDISTVLGRRKGCTTETQLQAVTALLSLNSADSIQIQKEEDAPIEFKIFDCIWYNGEDLRSKPLIERLEYARKAIDLLKKAGLKCCEPPMRYTNRKAFFDTILAQGGEGVILKNLLMPYIGGSVRPRDNWLKVKRTVQDALGSTSNLPDTLDGWVSGFEAGDPEKGLAGLVGSLDFSCKLKMNDGIIKDHVICRVSNLPLELRKQMTELDENGNPRLKKEWYGRMAELSCQCFSSRALRGKHAVLVGWRPDREGSFDSTMLTEEFVRSLVL